jgi:hypothetical protein
VKATTGSTHGTRGGAACGGDSVASEPFRFKICACCDEPLPLTPAQPVAFCTTCLCAWLDASIERVKAEANEPRVRIAPAWPGDAASAPEGDNASWSVVKEAERQISALAHDGPAEDRSEHYLCASREGCDPTLW